jgi:peptidoglycan hydrolase-like protein with peptidoglycan-binding domain
MRNVIIAGVSAVALGLGSAAFAAAPNGASGQGQQTEIMQAQQKLHAQGLYKGKVDGIDGPQTQAALRRFQGKNGLQQTGQLDRKTEQKLGLNATGAATQGYGSSVPPAATDDGGKHSRPAPTPGAGGPSGMPEMGKSGKSAQ